VLDWPEPPGALVSLILAGLFGVVVVIALAQTVLNRRHRWPHLKGIPGETPPEPPRKGDGYKDVDGQSNGK
jgi:hypothetical protein